MRETGRSCRLELRTDERGGVGTGGKERRRRATGGNQNGNSEECKKGKGKDEWMGGRIKER